MIFVANCLAMNGGTTFILRMCRNLKPLGTKVAIICITKNNRDRNLEREIESIATIYYLSDLVCFPFSIGSSNQATIFFPLNKKVLQRIFNEFGYHLHVSGFFGLYLSSRIKNILPKVITSIGVYHQNEFAFKTKENSFINFVWRAFRSIPSENLVFFNEYNRLTYSNFFNINYSNSSLLPIGVEDPYHKAISIPQTYKGVKKIILLGNLEPFKTYNEFIIREIALLTNRWPGLFCEIYGEGPEKERLTNLVKELRLENIVTFKGFIPYQLMGEAIKDALLFVGSGTAIIEASLQGVPALVGIESLREPKTYGYLNQIEGFSYNEQIKGRPLFRYFDLIDDLCSNDLINRNKIGLLCRQKALEFTIDKTAQGFLDLEKKASTRLSPTSQLQNIINFLSFGSLALKDKFRGIKDFRERRDQSL